MKLLKLRPRSFYNKLSSSISSEQKTNLKWFILEYFNITTSDFLLNDSITLGFFENLLWKWKLSKVLRGVPLDYILGYKVFLGERFEISLGLLIPREETQELILKSKTYLQSEKRLLDVGCGSGVIAISLKKNNPKMKVDALDVSSKAIYYTRRNTKKILGSLGELSFICENIQSYQPPKKYHYIFSNPPYIADHERSQMSLNVIEYEPHHALFASENGFQFYNILQDRLGQLLEKGGCLFVECGYLQANEIKKRWESFFREVLIIQDSWGKDRFVFALNYKSN